MGQTETRHVRDPTGVWTWGLTAPPGACETAPDPEIVNKALEGTKWAQYADRVEEVFEESGVFDLNWNITRWDFLPIFMSVGIFFLALNFFGKSSWLLGVCMILAAGLFLAGCCMSQVYVCVLRRRLGQAVDVLGDELPINIEVVDVGAKMRPGNGLYANIKFDDPKEEDSE